MSDDRKYDDEEFALILRRATELQRRQGATINPSESGDAGGFTLADIRQIASEAGIEASLIDQAATLIDAGRRDEDGLVRLMGGPSKFFYERAVPGEIREEDLGKLVDVIRRELAHQGEVSHVLNTLEWTAKDDLGSVHVNVAPRDEHTAIQVSADRSAAAGSLLTIVPLVGSIAGLIAAAGLDLGPTIEGLLMVLGAGGGSYVTARATWSAFSRRWRARLDRTLDALTRRAEELARPADEDPTRP